MNPKELNQKIVDEATNVYNIGEESDIFNSRKQKAQKILKDMRDAYQQSQSLLSYEYKSLSELNQMSIGDLQNELHAIQEHNLKLQQEIQKLREAEKRTSFLIHEKNKTNTENGNSVSVNQIRKRGNHNES
jgi:hypothetical protein